MMTARRFCVISAMPRSENQRLQDMRDARKRIAGFVSGLDFAKFCADQRTIRAVLYDLILPAPPTRAANGEGAGDHEGSRCGDSRHAKFGVKTRACPVWKTSTIDVNRCEEFDDMGPRRERYQVAARARCGVDVAVDFRVPARGALPLLARTRTRSREDKVEHDRLVG